MTNETGFPHQTLTLDSHTEDCELVSAQIAKPTIDPAAADVFPVARQLRTAGVTEIKLIHGTFTGNDVTGLMRMLSGIAPWFSSGVMELSKRWLDQLVGEVGNFTDAYADLLADLVNADEQTQIRIRRFHWSGENHHFGRALGAVSLLDQLLDEQWSGTERLLLLAHSHGGNLVAMMSLLLGGSQSSREAFVSAIDNHSKHFAENEQLPDWEKVRANLLDDQRLLKLPQLDVVTFGTPLRYRWDTKVCKKLMHVVHHCALNADNPAKAEMPRSMSDVFNAAAGDYVQHIGISGTDFPHPPI